MLGSLWKICEVLLYIHSASKLWLWQYIGWMIRYAVVTFQVELSAIVHSIISEDTRPTNHATEITLHLCLTGNKLPFT